MPLPDDPTPEEIASMAKSHIDARLAEAEQVLNEYRKQKINV